MYLYKLILMAIITVALSGCSMKSWDWFFSDNEEEVVYEEVEAEEGAMIEEEFEGSDVDQMATVIHQLQGICEGRKDYGMGSDLEALCQRVMADGGMVEEIIYEDEMPAEETTMERREPSYKDEMSGEELRREQRMEEMPRRSHDRSQSEMPEDGTPPKRTVIHFDYKQAHVTSKDIILLEKHAAVLKASTDLVITVEGHTDLAASADYNKRLGMRRARMVAGLLEEMGVNSNQVVTLSYGEERPVLPGKSPEANRANRRVELVY